MRIARARARIIDDYLILLGPTYLDPYSMQPRRHSRIKFETLGWLSGEVR